MAVNTIDDTEDVALNFGDEDELLRRRQFRRPAVAVFHLVFRTLALITYLLCGWFSNNFITSFVIILLLLSCDFWTVKNVTGRLLVGLRWWNYVDEDGVSHWVFESRKNDKNTTSSESRLFWLGLIVSPVIWIFLFVAALISFSLNWLIVVIVSLGLQGANVIGYVKCKKDARKQITSFAGSFLGRQLFNKERMYQMSSQPAYSSKLVSQVQWKPQTVQTKAQVERPFV